MSNDSAENKVTAKYMVAPARHPDETYEEYRDRRELTNKYLRKRLQKGRLFWPSSRLKTYLKDA